MNGYPPLPTIFVANGVQVERLVDSMLLNNTEYVLVGMLFQVRERFPGRPDTAVIFGALNLTDRSSIRNTPVTADAPPEAKCICSVLVPAGN